MTAGYFITGTDTGVGKTFVTCLLARLALARGHRVFAFKPIETGCVGLGEDQQALITAAGGWQTGDLRGCYQFARPAAPSVAATEPIDFERIAKAYENGVARADFVLVEGAGGWRVPIDETRDMSALADLVALPVIIVARASLGTINHSLLTAEAVGARLAAIVLSVLPSDDFDLAASNQAVIAARVHVPVLLHSEPLDVLFRAV